MLSIASAKDVEPIANALFKLVLEAKGVAAWHADDSALYGGVLWDLAILLQIRAEWLEEKGVVSGQEVSVSMRDLCRWMSQDFRAFDLADSRLVWRMTGEEGEGMAWPIITGNVTIK